MCAAVTNEAVDRIARALEELVTDDARVDLSSEDTVAAVELHFPDVRVRPLPPGFALGDECSVDGYYEMGLRPPECFILFDPTPSAARVRFTILHELGHHILQTAGADLLDDIDAAAGKAHAPASVEEVICHRFAARLLIPDRTLDEFVDVPLLPRHVVAVHDSTSASWEAVAVRTAERMRGPGAIVLVRDIGAVSFCAGFRLEAPWWARGSRVDPGGALAAAFDRDQTARRDSFRYGQAFARDLFCDTQRVHDGLAIGVLCDKPTDGRFDILVDPEPAWKDREEFCEWCDGERNVGWCDKCRGGRCRDCERCGCKTPVNNPTCPKCGMEAPMGPGETVCVDCALGRRNENRSIRD